MSGYGAIRKQIQQQQAEPAPDLSRCTANGCPGRATLSVEGGRWCCAAHAFAISDQWPVITERLLQNVWLIEFIDEIKRMRRNFGDWRGFAERFWEGQDESCAPDPKEEFQPYENRMRGELLFRAGVAKRPHVRLPKPVKAGGFRFSREALESQP